MSDYRTLNRLVLAKVESASGTDAVPTPGSNAILVENPNSNRSLNTFETNEVSGSLDARAPIASTGNQAFSGRIYLHGSGAAGTTLPEIDPLLKACGFGVTALAADVTGTAQAGAAGTITLAAGASATTNVYRGFVIQTTGGTGPNQTRIVTAYNGTTKVATVAVNWAVTPDATTTYAVRAAHLYRPTSTSIPTATIYEYLLRTDGASAKLYKHLGAAGTARFSMSAGQGCYFEFQMTGSLEQPTDPTLPSAGTFQETRPIPFVGAAVHLDGTLIKLRGFTYDFGNEVAQVENPNQAYGLDTAGIVRRRMGGSFQAPKATEAVRDVFSSWADGTEATLSSIWGTTAGNRFSVLVSDMIYTGNTDTDVNGFAYDDTPFRINTENDGINLLYW